MNPLLVQSSPLLHIVAQTMDEVLEAMESAFDDAGISYSGQVERDWAPTGALSSVNIAMAVHRVGRFAFREGLSRKDKMSMLRQAPVQRLLRMAYEVVGRWVSSEVSGLTRSSEEEMCRPAIAVPCVMPICLVFVNSRILGNTRHKKLPLS